MNEHSSITQICLDLGPESGPNGFKKDSFTDSQCQTNLRTVVHVRCAKSALIFMSPLPNHPYCQFPGYTWYPLVEWSPFMLYFSRTTFPAQTKPSLYYHGLSPLPSVRCQERCMVNKSKPQCWEKMR